MSQAQKRSRVGAVASTVLVGLFAALSLGTAHAENSGDVCSVLSGEGANAGYRVVDSRQLSHVQARPWNLVPEGVAFLLATPAGITATDLHRAVASCARAHDGVAGLSDTVRISTDGEYYVVKLTARDRARAVALSHAAK